VPTAARKVDRAQSTPARRDVSTSARTIRGRDRRLRARMELNGPDSRRFGRMLAKSVRASSVVPSNGCALLRLKRM
jgi:hypothetical protein